jgi:hypothetical protein
MSYKLAVAYHACCVRVFSMFLMLMLCLAGDAFTTAMTVSVRLQILESWVA